MKKLFGYRDFRLFAGIRFLCTLTGQLQATVLGYYAYQLTHNTIAIAIIGLCEALPAIGMVLFGGYIADKHNKRILLVAVLASQLIVSAVILAAIMRAGSLGIIYAMLFCNGFARAFFEPAMFAISAESVPAGLYSKAVNISTLSWQAANIAGPVIAGVLYAMYGSPATSFMLIAVLFAGALALAWQLQNYPPAPQINKEPVLKEATAGLHFIWDEKMMLYAMALDLFSVLFGGVAALLPVYAIDILHTGAKGLGFMRATTSAGAALAMLAMLRWNVTGRPWRNLLLAVTGFGIAVIMFGLSHSYLLSLFCLFAQGALDSISVVIRGTLLQMLTPQNLRGRVSAVNSIFISCSAEIGDAESGIVAKLLGTVPAVLAGGFVTLLVALFTWLKTKKYTAVPMEKLPHE